MQPDLDRSAPASPAGTPDSPSQSGKKRKAPAGSRGVASLTPEQLAKKRANDREAQRAIRERTKQQIENLERRIRELTSQQPYQDLQTVIRQKDALQAENEEIRRRLGSIMSIIQPLVGAQGLTGGQGLPDVHHQALKTTDLASAAQHNAQVGLAQAGDAFHQEPFMNGQQRLYGPTPMQQQGETSSYPPFNQEDSPAENRVWNTQRDALQTQRDNLQRGLELNDSGERLSFNFLLDNLGVRPAHPPAQPGQTHPSDHRSSYPTLASSFTEQQQPAWSILPKYCEPTCPLDVILINFIQSYRREVNSDNNNAASSSNEPSYPSVSSLLNPSGGYRTDPLSQIMTDIISKFPNISGLPEQAAILFMMFVFMRWLINPTQENYDRIPEWLSPRPSQLITPHPPWIDQLPWPRMRDKLVANYQDYPFETWFIPFTTGISVNWPYDPVDCLLSTSEKDDPIINPVFERHVRRLENWSLGPLFAEAFPGLVETARIKQVEPKKLNTTI